MNWQAAVAVCIAANAASVLIQRRYSQKSILAPAVPPAISYLLGVLPVGYLAAIFVLPHKINWSGWLILLLFINGISMAVAAWSAFKANKHLAVAPMQTIGRFSQIVVVALGWALLSEGLSRNQFLGATVILVGALMSIWAPQNSSKNTGVRISGVILAFISATALGISLVAEKALLGHMEVGGVFLVGWTAQTLAMIFLALKYLPKGGVKNLPKYEIKQATFMGLATGLSGVFYVYALFRSNNISLVASLVAVALPLSVLGAHVFLRERENGLLMYISLVITTAGLLIFSV